MPETVRVKSHFKHSVNYLKKLGVPANNSIQVRISRGPQTAGFMEVCSLTDVLCDTGLRVQVELGSAEGMALTAHSQFGGQRAGIQLTMKCLLAHKEFRGVMWHSWAWLQDGGLPRNVEVTWYIWTVYWFIELFIKCPITFVSPGPVLHPESLGSASVPSPAQCGRTQAAHLRLECQRGRRTSGAAALLLSSSFESDGDVARSGHRPDCSVQRSDY